MGDGAITEVQPLVMGRGGYHFGDYGKLELPLSLIVLGSGADQIFPSAHSNRLELTGPDRVDRDEGWDQRFFG